MKRSKMVLNGIALAAMIMLALAGCPQPADSGGGKSPPQDAGAAILSGIGVAGTAVETVPEAVSSADWDAEDFDFMLLEDEQLGQVVVDLASKLSSAAITPAASDGATVTYAATDYDKPAAEDFGASPLTLSDGCYLCIKVTSYNGTKVNYYVLEVGVANAVITISDVQVGGVNAEAGTPNEDYAQAVAGHVILDNSQKVDAQVTLSKGNSGQTLEYAKVAAANSTDEPVFGETAVYTFADGDILYIRVTAANRVSKNIYKIVIENDRAPRPEITAVSPNATYEQNDAAPDPISVTATGTGTLSYQWYSNAEESNVGGTLIEGATSAAFTPPVAALGKTYYYAEVTNTDTNVSGQQTASLNSAPIRVYVVAQIEKVEKIIAGASGTPVYRFTLPDSTTWGDYAKITFKVLVDDNLTINMAATRAHIMGNYPASNFEATGIFQKASNWNDARLVTISNSGAMSGILGTDYVRSTWKTLEYSIAVDNSKVDSSYNAANYYPAAGATGPFYLGVALSVNPNSNATGQVIYYVKDIALVSEDGSKVAPADDLNATFSGDIKVGQLWCRFKIAGADDPVASPGSWVERSIVNNPVPVEPAE